MEQDQAARKYSIWAGQVAIEAFIRSYGQASEEQLPPFVKDIFEAGYRECSRVSFLAGIEFAATGELDGEVK